MYFRHEMFLSPLLKFSIDAQMDLVVYSTHDTPGKSVTIMSLHCQYCQIVCYLDYSFYMEVWLIIPLKFHAEIL